MVEGGALMGGGHGTDDRGFLRVLCHEFRTPIASVQALANALTNTTRLSTDQRVDAARLIADHAAHLSAMLHAVGAVADHLPGTASGSRPTVARLADVISGAADAAGLAGLHVDVAPQVESVAIDVPTVRRILTNLLENARQHGAGPVQVRAADDAGALCIVITDNGPGMPAGVAARAFRQGIRAADTPHGLGLWIVTQLVAMLGGRVHADRNDPTGTRIEVVLPVPR